MPASNPYRKLPGLGGSLVSRHRLWLGGDHVLSVGTSLVGERYRRFYFADVQAFVWRRTVEIWIRAGLGFVIGGGAVTGGLLTADAARWTFFTIAFFALLVLAREFYRGPTVTCFVKTAVQFERLRSVSRERDLMKVLALLRPYLAAAQASLPSTYAP